MSCLTIFNNELNSYYETFQHIKYKDEFLKLYNYNDNDNEQSKILVLNYIIKLYNETYLNTKGKSKRYKKQIKRDRVKWNSL